MEPTENINCAQVEVTSRSPVNVTGEDELLSMGNLKKGLQQAPEESTWMMPKSTFTAGESTTPSTEEKLRGTLDSTQDADFAEEEALNTTTTTTATTCDGRMSNMDWDETETKQVIPTTTMVPDGIVNTTSITDTNETEIGENPDSNSNNSDTQDDIPVKVLLCAVVPESSNTNTTGVEVSIGTLPHLLPSATTTTTTTIPPVLANISNHQQHHPENESTTYFPQQQQQYYSSMELEKNHCLSVVALPNDALHSIASFLTPLDWTNFGRCDKGTNQVCKNVFRRVRMHGFRCATEVITAWKLDQHADAKELCALYIRAGVPIYPHSLGHSYHTLVWRLGVEAKVLREQRHRSETETSLDHGTTDVSNNHHHNANTTGTTERNENPPMIDSFFYEREEARSPNDFNTTSRSTDLSSLSYLEEKARYILKDDEDDSTVDEIARRLRRQMSLRSPMHIPPLTMARGVPVPNEDSHWRTVVTRDGRTSRPNLVRANSFSEFRSRTPKATLKIHRHLLDQHLLGKAAVNDNAGKMVTPPFNLSADFFHPHFSLFQTGINDVRQRVRTSGHYNSRQTSPTVSMGPGTVVSRHETPIVENAAILNTLEGRPDELPGGRDGVEILNLGHTSSTQLSNTDDSDSETGDEAVRPRPVVMELVTHEHVPDRPIISPTSSLTIQAARSQRDDLSGWNRQAMHDVLNIVDLDVYSASIGNTNGEDTSEQALLLRHLRSRYGTYQRRLEKFLSNNDNISFEECMLDFWDEFLPQTSMIHYYDKHTAVPRLSCLHKFLARPCPKAIGIVQCEIERIKVGPKKKGVNMKGRFFPTYEYRLFIRDRRMDPGGENEGDDRNNEEDETRSRRDTVLMVARNRGRKSYSETSTGKLPSAFSSKKGSNNYYIYLPQQEDLDLQFQASNGRPFGSTLTPNGVGTLDRISDSSSLLCRLQSNFIGTEFQIYTPRSVPLKPKPLVSRSMTAPHHSTNPALSSDDEDVLEGDDLVDLHSPSTPKRNRFSRLSLRGMSGNSTDEREPVRSLDSTNPSPLTLRRSRSSGDVTPRKSRPSRRVSAADAIETKHQPTEMQSTFYEEEDGAITYTANLLGSRPRIMDVCIPKVDSDGAGAEWKRYVKFCEEGDSGVTANRMLNHLKQLQQRGDDDWTANNNIQAVQGNNTNRNREVEEQDGPAVEYIPPDDFGLLALQNRPPWWNVELGSFVLNFGGRVSVASVKNFQLCDRGDQDYIMLQFGRIQGRHSFTMDFQYPLTGVQAFAIAISSLQSKISFG